MPQAPTELPPPLTEVPSNTPAAGTFSWPTAAIPFPVFVTVLGIGLITAALVLAAKRADETGGLLTISILLVVAFIGALFASMIYPVQQVPTTEILVGALGAALGGVVTFWMGEQYNRMQSKLRQMRDEREQEREGPTEEK